jgi:hypothetical protein
MISARLPRRKDKPRPFAIISTSCAKGKYITAIHIRTRKKGPRCHLCGRIMGDDHYTIVCKIRANTKHGAFKKYIERKYSVPPGAEYISVPDYGPIILLEDKRRLLLHEIRTQLPAKICILDLETANTSFTTPEVSKLAFVGVRIYVLHGDRYHHCKHRCFFGHEMGALEIFLKEFEGLIIGHNIFNFDYRVLRPLISLEGVLEKTIDTLAFLYKKNGKRVSGLSLDGLAKANLGKSKTLKGKSVPKLWNQGKRKEVIEYNKNDCVLTQALWWHLLSKRFVRINYFDRNDYRSFKKIRYISSSEILKLTGKKPMFDFKSWDWKIRKDGYILQEQSGF